MDTDKLKNLGYRFEKEITEEYRTRWWHKFRKVGEPLWDKWLLNRNERECWKYFFAHPYHYVRFRRTEW